MSGIDGEEKETRRSRDGALSIDSSTRKHPLTILAFLSCLDEEKECLQFDVCFTKAAEWA